MKKRVLLLSGALLCAGVILSGAPQRPAETVSVAKAKELKASVHKKYIGRLSADEDVELVPRVSGIIQKRCFTPGEVVKKGQLLFIIEDTTYRAQRDSAKAKLDQCEAEYRFAKQNLSRAVTLREQKAMAESAYDEAVRLEATSKAAVAAAKAALDDAENLLSYTRIYAPVEGRTDWAKVPAKNYVTPAVGTLLTIVSEDPIEVIFSISSRDFLRYFGNFENLKKYAEVTLELSDGSIYPEKAKITYMGNRVDRDTDSITIRGVFPNHERRLLADSLVTVHVSCLSGGNVIGITPSAMMTDGKNDFVYVLDDKNVPTRRTVKAGEITGGVQIITSGLSAGETVVVDGTHKVMPGVPVKPLFAGEK